MGTGRARTAPRACVSACRARASRPTWDGQACAPAVGRPSKRSRTLTIQPSTAVPPASLPPTRVPRNGMPDGVRASEGFRDRRARPPRPHRRRRRRRGGSTSRAKGRSCAAHTAPPCARILRAMAANCASSSCAAGRAPSPNMKAKQASARELLASRDRTASFWLASPTELLRAAAASAAPSRSAAGSAGRRRKATSRRSDTRREPLASLGSRGRSEATEATSSSPTAALIPVRSPPRARPSASGRLLMRRSMPRGKANTTSPAAVTSIAPLKCVMRSMSALRASARSQPASDATSEAVTRSRPSGKMTPLFETAV